jgi:cellulose synthase operon protein C
VSPSCDDLDPFFDGELPKEGAAAFRDHLGGCARCQCALRGRMLEASVVPPSQGAADAASMVPAAVALRSPRRIRRWAWVPAVAAAAAAAVVWWKVAGPSAEAPPPDQPAVALALKPQRGVDVRFSDGRLDGYRAREVVRSGSTSHEDIGRKALLALEERNELHALVGALALKGELASAAADARKLPGTAATLSDRAALALLDADPQKLRANAERAVSLVAQARRLEPALEQARWNEAVALERLGLTLAAAAAFDEIAQRGAAGWPAEAAGHAKRLRDGHAKDLAQRKELDEAAARMARGGAPISATLAGRSPSVARGALYLAVAGTADLARLDALAPLAGALGLGRELAQLRASDLRRRAPIARAFAETLEAHVRAKTAATADRAGPLRALRELRARARAAGQGDIARAVALAIQARDVVLADLDELVGLAGAGPWWRLVSVERRAFYLTYRQQRYAEADLVARDVVEGCRAPGRDEQWCPQILRTLAASNMQIGRVAHAYDLAGDAQRIANEARDREEEDRVFNVTGQIAAMRVVDFDPSPVADAYMRESALRNGKCDAALYRLDFGAHAALDLHRYADAGALLEEADRLTETSCRDEGDRYNAEEARLRLIVHRGAAASGMVARLERNVARIEARWGKALTADDRLFGKYLIARARLASGGGPEAATALKAVIEEARSLPAESYYPRLVLTRGHGALAEHAARGGAAGAGSGAIDAIAAIAARLGVALEPGCAVGVNHDERVTVVVRDEDGRVAAEIRDVPEGHRVIAAADLLSGSMRARLGRCRRIDVLATGPYLGVAGLLGPELRWAYRLSPRRATSAPRLDDQVVVTDVDSPRELALPPLRRMELGPSARIVERAAATPEGVLGAIARAGLVVINAHGITDANEPLAASLVLSPDAQGSYWLTADRVRQARLSGTPVVLLAACHAGRVQVSTEPWSLASSFLAAGARAVIAPTTEIPDDTANEVFASIVSRMQAGRTPEQAVAEEREARGSTLPWLANVVVFQ